MSTNNTRELPHRAARSIACANINLQYLTDEEDNFPTEIAGMFANNQMLTVSYLFNFVLLYCR